MDAAKISGLVGTRIFLASTEANLADPKTIEWLKLNKITKAFCLYPTNPKQFLKMDNKAMEVFSTMEKLYKAWKIDPLFVTELNKAGILVSSLMRNPERLREYDSFVKEAMKTRQNFLIQCYGGRHMSAAYAMYYLSVATPMTLKQIKEIFIKSGRGKDITGIEETLKEKKIYLGRIIERKLERMGAKTRKTKKNKTADKKQRGACRKFLNRR